jgi:hypothetical protein
MEANKAVLWRWKNCEMEWRIRLPVSFVFVVWPVMGTSNAAGGVLRAAVFKGTSLCRDSLRKILEAAANATESTTE